MGRADTPGYLRSVHDRRKDAQKLIAQNRAATFHFVISERYERGAILMSTNRAFKTWPEIFNNDTTLTSALLDRLLHHADICQIEGPSYRAKDHIES